jgi:hypothetical protein
MNLFLFRCAVKADKKNHTNDASILKITRCNGLEYDGFRIFLVVSHFMPLEFPEAIL